MYVQYVYVRIRGCVCGGMQVYSCSVLVGHELHGKTKMSLLGSCYPFSQFQARHEQVEWRGLQPVCKCCYIMVTKNQS